VDEFGEISNELKAQVLENIREVQASSKEILSQLKTATDMHIGLRLLHLFGIY
jgi:hypothetical protein